MSRRAEALPTDAPVPPTPGETVIAAGLPRQHLPRFLLVGAAGFVINTVVVALLVGLDVPDLLASILATETAIAGNYLGHELFTFRTRELRLRRFLGYNASATVGLVITSVVFTVLRGGVDWPLVAVNLVAVACGTGSNFLLSSRLVWRSHRE